MESANAACFDKSLLEWPALSDFRNSSQKDPASERHASNNFAVRNRRRQKPRETSGDSAKENENIPLSVNDCGTKKKSSRKTAWRSVPIEPLPLRERGNRRYCNANRGARSDGSGNFQGTNSRRERRDGDTSQYQQYELEEASIDVQSQVVPHEPHFATAVSINNTVYYNTYVYNAVQPQQTLHDAIRYQVEYYFSEFNLLSDRYLRLHMDKQGFVDIALIATFYKLKRICSDVNVIIEALKDSSKLEVSDDGKVRPVVNPLCWILDKCTHGCFDSIFNRIIFPPVNSMAHLNLNGDSNPEAFNSYGMNSEMGSATSGYHPIPVNGGHDVNPHFNQETCKPVFLTGEPDINAISRPLNSSELQMLSKFFDNMNINGDVCGDSAIHGPINRNSGAMCDLVGTNNDVLEHNAISPKKESINSVSSPNPFDIFTVDSSRCDNENINGDKSSNFTARDLVHLNLNSSRRI